MEASLVLEGHLPMPDAANTSKSLARSLILLVLFFPCAQEEQ
jgi:hypothetical protein